MKNLITLLFILLTHLFPLYGLLFLGWNPYQTVLVFNIETVIIIFFFLLDMMFRLTTNTWGVALAGIFITLPLIGFNMIHLAVSTLMFGTSGYSLSWENMYFLIYTGVSATASAIFLMFARHAYEFIKLIMHKDYARPIPHEGPPEAQNLFIRIVFMQFTIVLGGVFAKVSGHASWGVGILVVLQLIYTLAMYKKFLEKQKANTFVT